jgi:hypothetical protein
MAGSRIGRSGLTPVDFMLSTMRNRKLDLATRLDAARSVAPYLHPRLSAIEGKVAIEVGAKVLSDEQRREAARAAIIEAFRERDGQYHVIGGNAVPVEQANSEASDEREG